MDPVDKHAIHSSQEPNYRTSDPMFKALDDEFEFSVDLAALSTNSKCPLYLGPDHPNLICRDALDGFSWHWRVKELMKGVRIPRLSGFINPPYSRMLARQLKADGAPEEQIRAMIIENWAARCYRESQYMTIVGVFPAGTQTPWWQKYVHNKVREIRDLPHRECFLSPTGEPLGNAGVNTCVLVWAKWGGRMLGYRSNRNYWTYRSEK